jgi:ankyrin repeat protein
LVERGTEVNARGGKYGHPLLAAIEKCNSEIVCFMVERGATITDEGDNFSTLLQSATSNGDREIVRYLVERGTDVMPGAESMEIHFKWSFLKTKRR